jgi:hypothetical protein
LLGKIRFNSNATIGVLGFFGINQARTPKVFKVDSKKK